MRIMRGVLLDFQGTIFDLYDLKDNEDPWKLLRHSAWYKETTERQSSIMKLIQRAEVTKGHAEEKLLKRGDETEWREFFSGKFFSPLHEAFDSTKENSRKQVWFDPSALLIIGLTPLVACRDRNTSTTRSISKQFRSFCCSSRI